jgi:hypothetical protein
MILFCSSLSFAATLVKQQVSTDDHASYGIKDTGTGNGSHIRLLMTRLIYVPSKFSASH